MVFFFVAVCFTARFGSVRAGLLAIGLSAGLAGGYVLQPAEGFAGIKPHLMLLGGYVAVSLLTVSVVSTLRRRTQTLREKEGQLTDFVENATIGMHWVGGDGRVLWANQSLLEMLGYARKEYVNRNLREFHAHPGEARDLLARLDANESLKNYEARLKAKDGSIKVVLINSNGCAPPGDWVHTRCFLRDITAQKQAEEILSKSEASLRLAQRIGRIGSWEADLEKNTLQWSEETYRIFGSRAGNFTPSEASFFERVHPEDRATIRRLAEDAMRNGKRFAVDYRIVRPDGVERSVTQEARLSRNDRGEVTRLVGTVQDITERKQAESELAEQRNLLRTLIDNLPDYVYTKDTAGRYVICNAAHVRGRGGLSERDFSGRTVFDFFPRELAQRYHDDDQKVLASGQPLHDQEEPLANDVERVLLTTKLPLRDTEGRVTGLIGISRDITERKQAEAAIQKLNEELERRVAQRTAQLEEANRELEAFSYSISHDLRAPLRAIDGFAQIIREDYVPCLDDEGLRLFQIISQNSKKMGQLIDDMLAFAKLSQQEIRATEVDMNALTRSVLHDLALLEAGRPREIILPALPPVRGDEAMLRQVWANLLANALKFSRAAAAPRLEIGATSLGREIVYFVRDNGAGFDMRVASRLFQVFQRLHPQEQFEGTGVGLAIVQRIVARHGGRVWAEAKANEGATFYFALPIVAERAAGHAS